METGYSLCVTVCMLPVVLGEKHHAGRNTVGPLASRRQDEHKTTRDPVHVNPRSVDISDQSARYVPSQLFASSLLCCCTHRSMLLTAIRLYQFVVTATLPDDYSRSKARLHTT